MSIHNRTHDIRMARERNMYIYPYLVSVDDMFAETVNKLMSDTLIRMQDLPIEKRTWPINPKTSEFAQLVDIQRNGSLFFLGFSRLNMNDGPAKGTLTGKLVPFDLKEDEGFAHLAAALYDASTGAFVAENVRGSLSAERMIQYIDTYIQRESEPAPKLRPVIQEDIMAKIATGQGEYRRLELGLCPQYFSQADLENNASLGDVLSNQGMRNFPGTLYISFQARRNDTLSSSIKSIVHSICDIFQARSYGAHAIKKCKIVKNDENTGSGELLDLLNARVFKMARVKVEDKRSVSYEPRYRELRVAYNEWKYKYFTFN